MTDDRTSTETYPPGPCGHCGTPASVEAESRRSGHVAAVCYECGARWTHDGDRGEMVTETIECFGGKPGYAVGLAGPLIDQTLMAAGWRRHQPFVAN